jgi:hypothetical protein
MKRKISFSEVAIANLRKTVGTQKPNGYIKNNPPTKKLN